MYQSFLPATYPFFLIISADTPRRREHSQNLGGKLTLKGWNSNMVARS